MQVIVKKNVLEQLMKRLAEERSFHSRRYDQLASDEKPVLPDAQIAMQLSTDKVPVEDPDFLPVNKKQLSTAASQIAQEVTPREIQKFYKGLKKLIRKTSDPKQHKGMSETDLMEALRPLVLREAMLSNLIPTGDEEDVDSDETPDTGFRSGPTKDRYEGPKKRRSKKKGEERKAERLAQTAARAKSSSSPIVSIGGKKLKSHEIDELEAMRQKWTMAPDLIAMRQIRDQSKIEMEDIIAGDANRVLDIFEKSGLGLPNNFEDAKIGISVESAMSKLNDMGESTPIRRIRFSDLSSTPRPDLGKELSVPIVHTGGPIEVTAEYDDGHTENSIYYLLRNFPFNEQEYKAAFEKEFDKARRAMHDEALAALTARSEKEQRKLDAAAEKAIDKKKRAATLQAELGSQFARAEAEAMQNEDPSAFEKQLKKLGKSTAEFNSMSEGEKEGIIDQIAKNIERDRYQKIGLMARGRPSILDPDLEDIEGTESGEIVSKTFAGAAAEMLADSFFEKAFSPIAKLVYQGIVEDDPEADFEEVYATMGLDDYKKFISLVDMKEWISLIVRSCQNLITNNDTGEELNYAVPNIVQLFNLVTKPAFTIADKKRYEKLGLDEISTVRYLFTKESDEQLRALIRTVELATKYTIMSKRRDLTPEEIKSLTLSYIEDEAIDVMKNYGGKIQNVLRAQGKLKDNEKISLNKLGMIGSEEIFDIIGSDILASREKKDEMETQEVETAINENIESFLLEMDAQFETMAGAFEQALENKEKASKSGGKKKEESVKAAKSTKENVNKIVEFAYDMIESRPEA